MFNKSSIKKHLVVISIVFFCSYLTSCSNKNTRLSIGSSVKNVYNVFEKQNIISLPRSVIVLDTKNIIYHVNNFGKISEIKYIEAVNFDMDVFANNWNKVSLDDLIALVGAPNFIGLESRESVDFALDAENVYRLYLTYDGKNYQGNNVDTLAWNNSYTWIDENKTDLPSEEDLIKINLGMTIKDVVSFIGKPQREVGSGAWLYEFDLNNGKTFCTSFHYDYEKDNELYSLESEHTTEKHNLYLFDTWIE